MIVPLWLTAMGWLFAHDVWPVWTAREPPRVSPSDWLQHEGKRAQFAIHVRNRRVGTIWTEYTVGDASVQRFDVVWLDAFLRAMAPVRLSVFSTFTADGLLDEFTVQFDAEASRTSFTLHGERFHADFSFTFERGTSEESFKIPLTEGRLIGGAFNPFTQLSDLHVGQSWRMQVFNPIAALTGLGGSFTSTLVRVTGEQMLTIDGGSRRCFVVESPYVKALVDEHGAVQTQQIDLPLLGPIGLVRESVFDEEALARRRAHVFARDGKDEQ